MLKTSHKTIITGWKTVQHAYPYLHHMFKLNALNPKKKLRMSRDKQKIISTIGN